MMRASVRAAFQAARESAVTDVVFSSDAVDDRNQPTEFYATVCDVLCTEFVRVFHSVGFAIRPKQQVQARDRRAAAAAAVARLLRLSPKPTDVEAKAAAAQLDLWLQEHKAWTDDFGEAVPVDDLRHAVSSLAIGDDRGLARAAGELQANRRLDFHTARPLSFSRGTQLGINRPSVPTCTVIPLE